MPCVDFKMSQRTTNNKTCVTSKDSDQTLSTSMARVSFTRLLIAQRLWKAYAISEDAQADLSKCWLYIAYCRFCRAQAQMSYLTLVFNVNMSEL